jgi:hypothetical protein
MSIDFVIPVGRNVIEKEAGKILNYEDSVIEVQRRCNV